MTYGLPSPTPHYHPSWNLEISPMHLAPPPTQDSTSYPRQHLLPKTATRHLRLSSPFPISTLIKIILQKIKKFATTNPHSQTTHYNYPHKKVYSQTLPPEFRPHTHMHAYHEGSGSTKFSTWLERSSPWEDLEPRLRRLAPSGFFVGILF